MNKTDKLIAVALGLLLAGYVWYSFKQSKKEAEAQAQYQRDLAAWEKAHPEEAAREKAAAQAQQQPTAPVWQPVAEKPATPAKPAKPHASEKLVVLTNAQKKASFVFSTHGATLKQATLFEFATLAGEQGSDNPPLTLDFAQAPALALSGVPGLDADADWMVKERTENSVTFAAGTATRTITLKDDYQISVKDSFKDVASTSPVQLSLGVMSRGTKDGLLSIDSMLLEGEKPGVRHWDEEEPLQSYLSSGVGGGCSCSGGKAAILSQTATKSVPGASKWVAVKNGYFVSALFNCSENPSGFSATVARDTSANTYVPQTVSAAAEFKSLGAEREYTLYVGPKRQSLLWNLGLQDVMEFGMWRWLCYGLVWVLNLFYALIPNYGVAIILLTILVRLVFWPLTHKSTIGMRKMQEIQPLMKELQKKYKGNPQRLQQETWQLYREHKVNPLSSCLPMIVQIPVFFALFVVLRGAVELRYAPFLWIKDLSQPEALCASWFPFGGLNILPILMAVTMALQSALTPSAGDKSQQRMMMVFMPIMMLVMFYNFASALSLYWTLSQVLSIAQMWWIRKKYGTPAKASGKDGVVVPDAVEMPQTRQMRRHPSGGRNGE